MTYIKKNKVNILVIIIFLILPYLFFKDAFKINSVILGTGDPEQYYLPLRSLFINIIKNGELPFWNRYIFCGFPLLANQEAYIFYPIALIFDLLFPLTLSYNLTLLLHYSLAGIFMYLFLNEYKLNKIASFAGGMVYMLSGTMISQRSQPNVIFALVWIPLILLFIEKFRKTRRFEFILLASLFYAICYFGSNPQYFLYISILMLFFIIFNLFFNNEKKDIHFLLSGTVFLIGFLLISIQFFLTYQLMQNSFSRSVRAYNFFIQNSFDPRLLPILIFPFLFGAKHPSLSGIPSAMSWIGVGDSVVTIVYFGILTIPFLIFGFFTKNRNKYFWIFILILAFLLVFGDYNPLYKFLYHIPIYNRFRNPGRHWSIFSMAFSVIMAFGFDYFINQGIKNLKKTTLTIISIISSMITGFFIFYVFFQSRFREKLFSFLVIPTDKIQFLSQCIKISNYSIYVPLIILNLTIIILVISLFRKTKFLYFFIILLIFLDLFSMGHFDETRNMTDDYIYSKVDESINIQLNNDKNPFRIYSRVSSFNSLMLLRNMPIHYKIEILDGYDSLFLRDYAKIFNITDMISLGWIDEWESLIEGNNILSILNVKYILIPNSTDSDKLIKNLIDRNLMQNNYEIVLVTTDAVILENINYLERFYFVKEVKKVKEIEDTIDILNGKGNEPFNPGSTALINSKNFSQNFFNTDNNELKIIEYGSNSVELDVSTGDNSFLVFSDSYYPGWKAFIDGNNTEIYKTNGLIKGIFIPKGSHKIVFKYIPENLLFHSIISLVSFAGVISLIIFLMIKNKKRQLKATYSRKSF